MLVEACYVHLTIDDHSRHADAAFHAWNRDSIYIGVLHSGKAADGLGNFGCGNILTFSAEGIADAVDKIVIALVVFPHKVAGAKPTVAGLQNIAQNLVL